MLTPADAAALPAGEAQQVLPLARGFVVEYPVRGARALRCVAARAACAR